MMSRLLLALMFGLLLPLSPFLLKLALSPEDSIGIQATNFNQKVDTLRAELLMGLDLMVRSQTALREESGVYTKALGRIPDVLGAITQFYRVEIVKATRGELLILAWGESHAKNMQQYPEQAMILSDRVSIDEKFRVRTNFELPNPSRDYLHVLAQSVLNHIFANQFKVPPEDQLERWEGVYKGFFRYEERSVSQGGRTLVAIGTKAPVKGEIIEMQPGANLYEWVYRNRHTTGIEYEMAGNLEKVYLAQKIYIDHVGSYAPNFKSAIQTWNELSAFSTAEAPFALQEFQLDPTFGFHAEIANRAEFQTKNNRKPSGVRALSINGYGQISEVSSIEGLLQQFEQTRKQLNSKGFYDEKNELESDFKSFVDSENPSYEGEKNAEKPNSNPLLIDLVPENEK